MAELKFEAPLARIEGDDSEWSDCNEFQTTSDTEFDKSVSSRLNKKNIYNQKVTDNFSERFSDSLEDLVNTFDERITKCFKNFDENVEKFAPVQVRTQDEHMQECQMWWTITGNYGNILPIDWSKSYTQKLHELCLDLPDRCESPSFESTDEDDLMTSSGGGFDAHCMADEYRIQHTPEFTADVVIDQIERMLSDGDCEGDDEDEDDTEHSLTITMPCIESPGEFDPCPRGHDLLNSLIHLLISADEEQETETHEITESNRRVTEAESDDSDIEKKLNLLTSNELSKIYDDLERSFISNSSTLVTSLSRRDDLAYSLEVKNTFISEHLKVQKLRNKSQKKSANSKESAKKISTYAMTVIPYHPDPINTEKLLIFVKILKAINEDCSSVPTLLTDYILKALCPQI